MLADREEIADMVHLHRLPTAIAQAIKAAIMDRLPLPGFLRRGVRA